MIWLRLFKMSSHPNRFSSSQPHIIIIIIHLHKGNVILPSFFHGNSK